jgi:hypothetical protein
MVRGLLLSVAEIFLFEIIYEALLVLASRRPLTYLQYKSSLRDHIRSPVGFSQPQATHLPTVQILQLSGASCPFSHIFLGIVLEEKHSGFTERNFPVNLMDLDSR